MLRYLETFFRNRWLISIPAVILLFTGASLVLLVPRQYTISTTIWTEQLAYLDLPRPAQHWLTPAEVQSNRLNELRQIYAFARAVVDQTPVGMYGTESEKIELVTDVQRNLWTAALGENSVRIGFEHTDPAIALAVVEKTIEEYTRVSIEQAKLQSSEAVAFYRERIREYEQEIVPQTGKAVTDYLQSHPELRTPGANRTDPNFLLIQQQADTAREELESYKRRLDQVLTQTEAVSRNQSVAFRVLDPPAIVSDGKISKKTLAVYAGVGVGLAMAYAMLYILLATELDRTMRDSVDVRRRLGLEVLEVIPEYTGAAKRKQRRWRLRRERRAVVSPAG